MLLERPLLLKSPLHSDFIRKYRALTFGTVWQAARKAAQEAAWKRTLARRDRG